jgi:hypothetical protein
MSYAQMLEKMDAEKAGPDAVLEVKQAHLLEGVIDGKTATEAAESAGFGVAECRTPWKLVQPDQMRAQFQEAAHKRGMTLNRIAAKIEEHLEARANQTLNGKEVTQSKAPDYKVQQKALEQLTTLIGMQDASKAAQAGSSITLSISGPAADRLAAMLGGN